MAREDDDFVALRDDPKFRRARRLVEQPEP
jgi:hypothetical protein